MPKRLVAIKWFLIGSAAALALTMGQVSATGDLTGLLQVGENSALRPVIEKQLGEVHLAPGTGHDGQIYYGIALDPNGTFVPPLIGDEPGYRYRRILFPLITSGFGIIDGWPLMYSMVIVNIVSVGIATSTVALLAVRGGKSQLWALTVILNPGVWLSIFILTGDALSIALMLIGITLIVSRRRGAAWAFAGSVLAKDVAILTPLGLWSWQRRRTWWYLAVPSAIIASWVIWTASTMGGALTARGNLTFPFFGMMQASSNWTSLPADELLLLGFALLTVLFGLAMAYFAKGPFRWCVLLWSTVGVMSSNWVWDFGNNAVRVTAPLVILMALNVIAPPIENAASDLTEAEVEL